MMHRTVWGVIKGGVVVPETDLPEGRHVEITLADHWKDMIHDRGRGPEIIGTRITVYDVLDYLLDAWPPYAIAALFRIETDQVEAAVAYINEHTIEVLREYIKILERCERGNPPELQAKIDANHARFQELVSKIRQLPDTDPQIRQEKIAALIREHRRSNGQGGNNGRDHAG